MPKPKQRDHHYHATIVWDAAGGTTTGYKSYGRDFRVSIPGKPSFVGSADAPFRGTASRYNPEDMLVVALSSCHMLSYLALAAFAGIEVVAYEDDAEGTMVQTGTPGRFTEVVLRPRVWVAPGADLDRAKALHGEAHKVCFIANSVNFPVRHEARVEVRAST